MNTTRLTVIAFAAAAVALTGCSSGSLDANSINTISATSDSPAASETPATSEAPAVEETAPAVEETSEDSGASGDTQLLAFGQTYTSPDGNWSVSVSQPVKYRKSQYASGGDGFTSAAKVKITVKNLSTGKSVDPSNLDVTATSGDREADAIYDFGNGLSGSPDAVVLPGRSVSWTEAFGATPGETFTVQVQDYSDFSSGPIIFDGKLPA